MNGHAEGDAGNKVADVVIAVERRKKVEIGLPGISGEDVAIVIFVFS